jgi:serine protease Do
MKKILLAVSIVLFSVIAFSPSTTLHYTWDKDTVQDCLESAAIVTLFTANSGYMGSGTIIDKEGLVLTAAHVVNKHDFADILVEVYRGNTYLAEILYVDVNKDLALIRPIRSAQNFRFAKIQESNKLHLGQDILVVGSSLLARHNITTGRICKFRKTILSRVRKINFTALVFPGNSGGPIFNTKGEVIGVVTARYTRITGAPTGIGIGTHISEIHSFIKDYKKTIQPEQIKRYRLGEVK